MSSQKVFDCDDLRKYIFEFIPKKCLQCNKKMHGFHKSDNKFYLDKRWCSSRNKNLSNYCNWCYYYVFEYL